MLTFKTKTALSNFLSSKEIEKTVGFVPTMGALHAGHLSLIQKSVEQNDITVVSIFVNPTQFNNAKDLENYPRKEGEDLKMLKRAGVEAVFLPNIREMYPSGLEKDLDFVSDLFNILEGKFRPGHFAGVAMIVKKLFEIVKPDKVYFGKKDYQQVLIIRKLIEFYNLPISLQACPIIREKNGLAMSSRNRLLTPENQFLANKIFEVLAELERQSYQIIKKMAGQGSLTPQQLYPELQKLLKPAKSALQNVGNSVKLEYLEMRSGSDLSKLVDQKVEKIVFLVAVFFGKVRLIDNLELDLKLFW